MARDRRPLTIGALARAAGVGVETVRYYQRRGLLPCPARPPGGTRRYGATELARLRFIRRAKTLGFSLEEIAELLRLEDGLSCNEASAVARRRLTELRGRIAELQRIEATLAALLQRCKHTGGTLRCPLIERIRTGP
ncbi:MAG: MerR family transcriptional regulator [Gammaproteobacteria bacterium]|nr:MAG: MerR family transcriptional regulator [Gammaproteobacteria bacterium]